MFLLWPGWLVYVYIHTLNNCISYISSISPLLSGGLVSRRIKHRSTLSLQKKKSPALTRSSPRKELGLHEAKIHGWCRDNTCIRQLVFLGGGSTGPSNRTVLDQGQRCIEKVLSLAFGY